MKQKLWLTLVGCIAYCIDKELYKAIDYLREQVRVLVEHQEKQNKRIILTKGKRYLIHDRDPLYRSEGFHDILRSSGIEPIKLPAKSPDLNSIAERYVKSVKYECLNFLILSSVKQLEYALNQYQLYYHHERIHQSLGRIIEPKHKTDDTSEIVCIERLGGLLKSYHRLAA